MPVSERDSPGYRDFESNFLSRRDAVQRNSNAGCEREKLGPQHARLQWLRLRQDDWITDLALPLRYRECADRRNALISAIWERRQYV